MQQTYPTQQRTPKSPHVNLHKLPPSYTSIIIKDLVRIQQYRLDHLGLEARIGQIRVGAHEGRPEDDGQVLRRHAVDARLVHNTEEVQREGAEGGVVGVW
jgi:hypothetical protein